MATIDYKDKYEKAVQAAMLAKQDTESAVTIGILEEIFPELKESEDEKIRKEIIATIHLYYGEPLENEAKEMIAWLEKQGEQKPADLPNGEDYGIDGLYHAISILEKTLGKVDGYQSDDGILEHKCAITAVKKLYNQKPAEWSEEDENIINHLLAICAGAKRYRQFAGCSQDDVTKYQTWLKSLKKLVLPQPKQEWSEKDEKIVSRIASVLEEAASEHAFMSTKRLIGDKEVIEIEGWLKSLEDRYTWKPSELQLECLSDAIEHYHTLNYPATKLVELLEQLKKL